MKKSRLLMLVPLTVAVILGLLFEQGHAEGETKRIPYKKLDYDEMRIML